MTELCYYRDDRRRSGLPSAPLDGRYNNHETGGYPIT